MSTRTKYALALMFMPLGLALLTPALLGLVDAGAYFYFGHPMTGVDWDPARVAIASAMLGAGVAVLAAVMGARVMR